MKTKKMRTEDEKEEKPQVKEPSSPSTVILGLIKNAFVEKRP